MADTTGPSTPVRGEDRRAWPRYAPPIGIPVTFQHARLPGIGAGDIVDLSAGGVRIVAPPTVTTPLRWGDPVTIALVYSVRTRAEGLEGLVLEARVIEVCSNAQAYTVRACFLEPLDAGTTARLAGIVSDPP